MFSSFAFAKQDTDYKSAPAGGFRIILTCLTKSLFATLSGQTGSIKPATGFRQGSKNGQFF